MPAAAAAHGCKCKELYIRCLLIILILIILLILLIVVIITIDYRSLLLTFLGQLEIFLSCAAACRACFTSSCLAAFMRFSWCRISFATCLIRLLPSNIRALYSFLASLGLVSSSFGVAQPSHRPLLILTLSGVLYFGWRSEDCTTLIFRRRLK